MSNPFDADAQFFVLVNEERQYSLWPVFKEIPAGWTQVGGARGRQECLDFIEDTWTDMRPKSLIEQMERDAAGRVAGGTGVAAD